MRRSEPPLCRPRARGPRRAHVPLLVAAVALALAGCTASGARAVPTTARTAAIVDVFPSPGTRTASPDTSISFRGVAPADLGRVRVSGSTSGLHTGRLLLHSDGHGVSFVPDTPFAPGEEVTVQSGLRLRGGDHGTVRFSVAVPAPVPLQPAGATVQTAPASETQLFHSRPDLSPPVLDVAKDGATAPGDLLFTLNEGPNGSGPMVLDDSGQLVWFDPLPAGTGALDLQRQRYQGQPVLTWWQGSVLKPGYGRGVDIIEDDNYREVARVEAGNGYAVDLHDMQLTPQGTALITVYDPIRWDLSAAGGSPNGIVYDGVVQEIDVATGAVLFEWHSLDHVPVTDSDLSAPKDDSTPFDFFHVNSVDREPDGNLLVSARHTSTLYEIDHDSGRVLWRLGGKRSDFTVPANAEFAYQHDARRQPDGTITLFDNGSGPIHQESRSSALQLRVEVATKKVRLVHRYLPPEHLLATSQGSVQILADHHVFVGWGSKDYVTEFRRDGTVVYDAHLARGISYRTFRDHWVGRPLAAPDVAVQRSGGTVTAYASWNGDTVTTRWQLLAGASPADLAPVASTARSGFETTISAPTTDGYVAVRALDVHGDVLGESTVRRVP